jgi:hypothetical protein
VEAAARSLEDERVDVIVAMTTSVTLAAKRATKRVPIVFYASTDPVSTGLVESFRKPGGRLTGVHSQSAGLAGKRLELLKEMIPSLRRVVTFYPTSPDLRMRRLPANSCRSITASRRLPTTTASVGPGNSRRATVLRSARRGVGLTIR